MKKITLLLSLLFFAAMGYGQAVIFEENFDGDAIPDNWSTSENGDGGQVWTFGSGVMPGTAGVGSADFPTNAAIFDDDASGSDGNHDKSHLLFPVAIGTIDLTDYLDMQITLEYEYALNVLSPGGESLELLISDGESGFITEKSYSVDTDITLDTVDVSQLLIDNPGMDVTNFFFKFVYDDIDGGYAWGAGVDNVRMIATPMNDLCENAIALTIGGEFSDYDVEGTLLGSGMEHRPWVDVWYTVVVPSSGGFVVETAQDAGSVMDDTWLEVHEGACADLGAASRIASDDDSGTGSFSKITITGRTPGEVLFVHVGKDGSYSGVLDTFLVSAYAIPPANDICTNAQEVMINSVTAGTSVNATGNGETGCGISSSNVGVWYYFNIAGPESIDVWIENSNFDPKLSILGACSLDACIVNDDDSGEGSNPRVQFTPGGSPVYIYVVGFGDASGTFILHVANSSPNDDCDDAIALDVQYGMADFAATTPTPGTVRASIDSGVAVEACDGSTGNADDDVWYSFTPNSDELHITVDDDFDGVVNLFEGSCDGLTLIDCADLAGENPGPQIDATGLTPGDTYYVRVFSYSAVTQSSPDFTISVWSDGPGVGIAESVIDGFKMYPNPVEDMLNIAAENNIETISIYNLLGQEVLQVTPSTTTTQVDMSYLPTGAYIVKVQAGEQVGSYNLIKE